jgi:hypothetical protein
MAYNIQAFLNASMSPLGIKSCTTTWDAYEHNQQFGENHTMHIGKSHRVQKDGKDRINIMSAMRSGLAEKMRNFIFQQILKLLDWMSDTHTCSLRQVRCLSISENAHRSTAYARCEDTVEFDAGLA